MQTEIKNTKISDLKPMEERFRLSFKVMKKSEIREVTSRNNDDTHRISDVTVSDETGSILLSAWDDDIELLEQGKFFKIENGYVNVYRDSLRLGRGKFGSFEPIEEEFEVNETNNRSDETHERPQRRSNYQKNRKFQY
ncbi:MAG: single-stranded DNA-binding protein [Candidatus Hodarchaeales archaeon]|jgi:replication factor A1